MMKQKYYQSPDGVLDQWRERRARAGMEQPRSATVTRARSMT